MNGTNPEPGRGETPDRVRLSGTGWRNQLREVVTKLSDTDWQKSHWIDAPQGDDDFDTVLDFLDDSGLGHNPAASIGSVFVDGEEAAAMATLNSALDTMLDLPESAFAQYSASKQWPVVVSAAQAVLTLLTSNEPGS